MYCTCVKKKWPCTTMPLFFKKCTALWFPLLFCKKVVLTPEERGGRGAVISMMMEAQKRGSYCLPRQGLLGCELLAIPAARTVSSTEPTVIIQSIVSQRMLLRDVLHTTPCNTSPPAGKLTNGKSGNAANSSTASWVRFLHMSNIITTWNRHFSLTKYLTAALH